MSDESTYDYGALLALMQGGGIPAQNAGVVDDYGGTLTDLNKLAGMATDWDFLAQNPHLITAEGMSDTTTYSPVELQYESLADAYRRSIDPRLNEVMYYVDQGVWDASVIAEAAAKAQAEATGVEYDAESVDKTFVEQAISRLSQAQLDDTVALQGAELMMDSDGVEKYMVGETKEHPFLEHVRDLGYVNDPRDTYDPYDIAPVGQRELDARTIQKYEDDKLASEEAMRAYSEAGIARGNRKEILRDRENSSADPGRAHKVNSYYLHSPARQGGEWSHERERPRFGPGSTSMGREPAIAGEYGGRGEEPVSWTPAAITKFRREAMQAALGERGGRDIAGLVKGAYDAAGNAPRTAAQWAPDDERYAALGRASRAAGLDAWVSDAKFRTAESQDRARKATVRRLRDAGFSPFADEVRRRNSGIVPGL